MIVLGIGDSLQARASAASSLAVAVYGGLFLPSGKILSRGLLGTQIELTGGGTDDVVYTFPATTTPYGSYAAIDFITISNRNAASRTVRMHHVVSGGSPGTANHFAYDIPVAANSSIVFDSNGWRA
jgi:hypothetical protein